MLDWQKKATSCSKVPGRGGARLEPGKQPSRIATWNYYARWLDVLRVVWYVCTIPAAPPQAEEPPCTKATRPIGDDGLQVALRLDAGSPLPRYVVSGLPLFNHR